MPANTLAVALRALATVRRRRESVVVNPAYRERLASWGLVRAEDFLNCPGEIVSGHPDRHVMYVRVGTGPSCETAYLKREHSIPWRDRWKNAVAGFGFVSVSRREAAMLEILAEHAIPAADWLAAGEDGRGRAFLLVRAAEGCVDLRHYLREHCRAAQACRRFARRLGRLVARIHDAGIEYPDLYAKHILIAPDSGQVTFLDWQRSPTPHRLSWRNRCRDLAALNASLADELAGPMDRFAFLQIYLRASRTPAPRLATICRRLERRTRRLLRRSSIREQRLPTHAESQRLIWLAGEELCVTPAGAAIFSTADWEQLAYGAPRAPVGVPERSELILPDGRPARLVRRRTARPLAGVVDRLHRRRWTSPEARAAAELLRRERLGEPATLLGFGQRFLRRGVVDSFLLVAAGPAPERQGTP